MGGAVNAEDIADSLVQWYDRMGPASLKLPNGWFGRPVDNMHDLTLSFAAADRLIIVLDNRHVLIATHPSFVEDRGPSFSLSGFSHVVWDWDEYGSDTSRLETFAGGAIEFHSHQTLTH